MNFQSIFRSDFTFNAIKKMSTIVSGLLGVILLTRYLGPELRGEYAYFYNSVNILTTVFNLGISLVFPHYMRHNKGLSKDDFVSISLIQFLIYVAIIAILSFFISQQYIIVLLVTALAILVTQINNLTLLLSIKNNAISNIASSVINCLILAYLFFFESPSFGLAVWAFVVKELVIFIVSFFYIKFVFVHPKKEWLQLIKHGFLPMIVTALISLNYRLNTIILEWFNISNSQIGLFAVGVSLAEYSWMIPDIFKEVMLNKSTKKDEISLLCRSIRFSFSFVLLFAIVFVIMGRLVILVFFGQEYSASYPVTVTMFLAVPFMVFVKIVGVQFIVKNMWMFYLKILSCGLFANILICMVLIPYIGIMGAAVAAIASYFICGMLCLRYLNREYGVPYKSLFIVNRSDIKLIHMKFVKK